MSKIITRMWIGFMIVSAIVMVVDLIAFKTLALEVGWKIVNGISLSLAFTVFSIAFMKTFPKEK